MGPETIVTCHDRTITGAGRPLEVKFARITQTGAGTATVVAGVASKKIRVLAMEFVNTTSVSLSFQSNATALFVIGVPNGTPFALRPNGYWICETVAGEDFRILSSGGNLHGRCAYCEVG